MFIVTNGLLTKTGEKMSYSILRLPEVISKTGLARSTIYGRIKSNAFPMPISLGSRAMGFIEQEVDEWIEAKITESRGGSSKTAA